MEIMFLPLSFCISSLLSFCFKLLLFKETLSLRCGTQPHTKNESLWHCCYNNQLEWRNAVQQNVALDLSHVSQYVNILPFRNNLLFITPFWLSLLRKQMFLLSLPSSLHAPYKTGTSQIPLQDTPSMGLDHPKSQFSPVMMNLLIMGLLQ